MLLCTGAAVGEGVDERGNMIETAWIWVLIASAFAAQAVWLRRWTPIREMPGVGERLQEVPLPLVLGMLSVAIRQGASISHALIVVGEIVSGKFGDGLQSAGRNLNQGVDWDDAWPDEGDLTLVRDAFASSWRTGSSPVNRLDAAVEQIDWNERSRIEQSAARLSIKLLLPTGLCFLPAFMALGVIPSMASFFG